ncbi:MAG: (2Fe-2S) ferredoxin domain-containing protein [Polyangia bacterium]
MGKKKKLKKKIGSRLADDERALVVCVGKRCAPREESRALVEDLRRYVAAKADRKLRVEVFGCLGICKKGPIVATLPEVHIYKHVDSDKGHRLADELAEPTP